MKREQIRVGGIYSNGKEGRHRAIRRVVSMGPAHVLYRNQADTDCLAYERIDHRKPIPEKLSQWTLPTTCRSFQNWAKEELPAPAGLGLANSGETDNG